MNIDIKWHPGNISAEDRRGLYGQHASTIWLTGLSGSGKSTLAFGLERHLITRGRAAYALDGDNVRHGLSRDLGFSPAERKENIRRVAEVARLFNDAGLFVVTAFISPYREDRDLARAIIGPERFLETYLSTPIGECERRDPKGLYRKARAGLLPDFTGVSAPYEPPPAPAISLDTTSLGVEDCLGRLLALLEPRILRRDDLEPA